MDMVWSNKYLNVRAEIGNLGTVEKGTQVECVYTLKENQQKLFKIDNTVYPVITMKDGKPTVDEFVLSNKILTDLSDNCEIDPVFESGESGKYLIEKAQDKNFYYEDGFVYDLYKLKRFRQSKLKQYIDEVDDDYLKEANQALYDVIDALNVYDCTCLVKNNLHFELADEGKLDKDFGRITPVYGKDAKKNRKGLAGLVKHTKNHMVKYGSFDIADIQECVDILKKRTKDTHTWEDRRDGLFYKLIRQDGIQYDILVEDDMISVFGGGSAEIFKKEQIDKILKFIGA